MIKKKIVLFLVSYTLALAFISAAGECLGIPLSFPDWRDLAPFAGKEEILKKESPPPAQDIFITGQGNSRLSRFFMKLHELEKGKRTMVRIHHFGDSLIWADNFSSTLRRRFQLRFGDGGRGIVPAAHVPYTVLDDHVNATPPGHFTVNKLGHRFYETGSFKSWPDENRVLGFTGESCTPLLPGATVSLKAADGAAPWARLQLFLRAGAKQVNATVNLAVDSGKDMRTAVIPPDGTLVVTVPSAGTRSFTFDFKGSDTLPYVDGINLEAEKGIAYSTFVRMGTHLSWLAAVSEPVFAQGMKEAAPDLIIFQYGINEAASLQGVRGYTGTHLRDQMTLFLSRVKRILPDTDVLIIGPPERLVQKGAGLVTMKETLDVIDIQRESADAMGFAFFDLYRFLGGQGQMTGLAARGLALNDYMHLSRKGGDELGGRVFHELMKAYDGSPLPEITPAEEIPSANEGRIVFNSAAYAWFLALTVLGGLILLRVRNMRIVLLLAASLYFYFTWEARPLILMAAVAFSDYLAALLIHRSRSRGGRGTIFLAASIFLDVGILAFFKYAPFMGGAGLFPSNASDIMTRVIMPAGLSFYIFKSLSYTIDVWRGNAAPARNPLQYLLFVSFFPQILAGPISRARDFLGAGGAALRRFAILDRFYPRLASHHVSAALFMIVAGLMKKAGADWLGANLVDRVYGNPGMFSSLETLAAVLAYGAQIYLDFSGYSDIAIGSASLLGYRVPDNFRRPYLSLSITDFWRRWHITLGSWFRDYIYISIGGNRNRVYLNLLITMGLCGIWHGSGLNFAVWGLYHGFFLALERAAGLNRKSSRRWTRAIRTALTLGIVLFGWIIFRVDSWDTFAGIMGSLASLTAHAPNLDFAMIAVILFIYAIHFTPPRWKREAMRLWRITPTAFQGIAAAAVTIVLFNIAVAGVRPFIYLRF